MPNLLIITPHFPSPDHYAERARDPRTKFLFDFAEAWTNQGCRVQVIHLPPRYPKIFNALATHTTGWPGIRRLRLNRFSQDPGAVAPADFVHAGIRILRQPIPKHMPHRDYGTRVLKDLTLKLVRGARRAGLKADLILADYLSPSLTVGIELGKTLNAPVFPVIHQTDLHYFCRHRERFLPALQYVPAILFRSSGMARRFSEEGVTDIPRLFLYSGIPDSLDLGSPRREIHRLLYAGTLRRTKNIHLTLHAIAELYQRHPTVMLDVVGSGEFEPELRQLTDQLGLAARIHFHGKCPREEVFEHMRRADALVMVSKESFGMAYIEAMSQGCVVVAAEGEGIDGIVRHGDNGLLVALDDQQALTRTLDGLLGYTPSEIDRISTRAIQTAAGMRNDTLAREMLERLMALKA
jgi:L-malate glycosyltransferase